MFETDFQKITTNNIKITGKQYLKKKKNTYSLVCRKRADNKKIRGVALVNKIAIQRSLCTVCTSRKSTFLKRMKKKNWAFWLIKACKLTV